jgi:putative ABC transport system substrate-binding protein
MRRREIIKLLGGAAVTWPLTARAQQDRQIPRIGFLTPDPDSPLFTASYPAFLAELQKLGFTEGKRLIEFRRADEGVSKAFAAAAELIRSKAGW